MHAFEQIAEERIRQAIEAGEFDNLPGAGQPLHLDDDLLVPEELRMAYRILKNAGFVPPELEHLRELRQLEASLADTADETARLVARKRMELILTRLEQSGAGRVVQQAWNDYAGRIIDKLDTRAPAK